MSSSGYDAAPPPPVVPGAQLLSLLRFSRSGETWLAKTPSGESCAVTLVPAALISSAEPLLRLRHDHLLPVQDVVAAGRQVALRTPVPPQATLASLCAVRTVLDPGEVVTVGVPVAQALACAHDRGFMHGDLDPADICLDDDGRPVLTGIGLAGLAGHAGAPADDVLSLAMILRALLGDDTGPRAEAIRGVLGDALSGQAAGRPSAQELAQRLGLACPAQPLRWPRAAAPTATAAPVGPGRRRAVVRPHSRWHQIRSAVASRVPVKLPVPGRGALAAILAVAGIALLLVVAPMLSKSSPHRAATAGDNVDDFLGVTPDPAASATVASPAPALPTSLAPTPPVVPTPVAPDWTSIARGIAAARDAAFSGVPASVLTSADAAGSAAASVDAAKLASLRRAGVHARGLVTTIHQVVAQQTGAEATVLRLSEQTSSYDLVSVTGVIVEHRRAGTAASWTVTVVHTASGWRTANVTAG